MHCGLITIANYELVKFGYGDGGCDSKYGKSKRQLNER